jgi:DNA-binding transcriptional regulator YiaG
LTVEYIYVFRSDMSPAAILGLRKKLGLSQAKFAKRIRYARITVSLWERGNLAPGPDAVKAMRNVTPAKT